MRDFINTYIGAIGTIIGAVIGAVIGSIGTYYKLSFNYKELYAKTISESRNRWIDIFRENIPVMLAEAESYIKFKCMCGSKKETHYNEFCKARGRIVSRLNENEEDHLLLQNSILKLNIDKLSMFEFIKIRELILIQTRLMLKPEWERVKREASGKK